MTGSHKPDTFVYRSLEDLYNPSEKLVKRAIRILELLPGKNDAEIVCIVSHNYLEDKPQYEALSYVWGKEMSANRIKVSNLSDNPVDEEANLNFDVTMNLYAALRDLRDLEAKRRLWIDAICINQSDSAENKAEKSLQVSRMRDIYLHSERVVAYLGEQRDAMETIKFCQSLVQDTMSNVPAFYASSVQRRCACLRLFGFPDPVIAQLDIQGTRIPKSTPSEHQVERPYWTRSWILQELIHDRPVTLYFGRHDVSIKDFLQAFSLWYDIVILVDSQVSVANLSRSISADERKRLLHEMWFRTAENDEMIPAVIATEREKFQGGAPSLPRLPALLKKFRGQRAGLAVDKIYAFLGMTANEYQIEPDYSKSTYEVFTEITKRHLMKNVLLVLLWVESKDRKISAGDMGKVLPSWVPDFSTEQGLIAKCLQSTYDAFHAYYPAPPPGDKWRWSFDEDVLVLRGKHVGVITDVLPPSHVTKHEPGHEHDQITLMRYNSSVDNSTQQASTSSLSTYENTSWGPGKCEIGDIIIVAGGCRLPIVLRKLEKTPEERISQDEDNNQCVFVGCCWLISGELQDLTKVNEIKSGSIETKERTYVQDKGFSKIMYGSLKVESDGLECVEEYFIH